MNQTGTGGLQSFKVDVKPGFHKPISTTTTTNFESKQSDYWDE